MRISDWSSDVCSSDLSSPASKPQPPPAPMKVLGLESSCDQTGVAVYDTALARAAGLRAHGVYRTIALHARYGGGVPGLATRGPGCMLLPLNRRRLAPAGRGGGDRAGVDVQAGPGPGGAGRCS